MKFSEVKWKILEKELQVALQNEKLWLHGSTTPEEISAHENNCANIKLQLSLIKDKNYEGLLLLNPEILDDIAPTFKKEAYDKD
jgi:hypothetical protein